MQRILWLLAIGIGISFLSHPASAQVMLFRLEGIGSQSIPVTINKMTNIVFPVNVLTGVKVSKGIIAQKVRGVENVIEVKAVRRDFAPTNLSVYGINGRLYSFVFKYTDDSSVLNFRIIDDGASRDRVAVPDTEIKDPPADHPIHLTGLPADLSTLSQDAGQLAMKNGFLHISASREKMRVALEGIYLRDGLEWMVFRLSNRSLIAYKPAFLRFNTEDRKKVKRRAIQQVVIDPVYDGHPDLVRGDTVSAFAVGFTPFTVGMDKKLTVEIAEPEGGRVLMMSVKAKMLLRARKG